MKKIISNSIATILLTGCYNTSNYNSYISYNAPTLSSEVPDIKETKNPTGTQTGCGIYIPLVHPALPEVPIDKIKRASDISPYEMKSILTDHIRDLRVYAVNIRVSEQAHYKEYLKKCGIGLNDN